MKVVVDKRAQVTNQNKITALPTNDAAQRAPTEDATARFDQIIQVTGMLSFCICIQVFIGLISSRVLTDVCSLYV